MPTKKPSEDDLKKIASDMIADQVAITLHSAGLEAGKVKLRDYCTKWNDKKGFKLTVEGLGVVSVSAPSAGKEAGRAMEPEKITFDPEKFKALDAREQRALIEAGVVKIIPAEWKDVPAKPEGTPAITVTVVS